MITTRTEEYYQGYRDSDGAAHIAVLRPRRTALGEITGWRLCGEVAHRVRHCPRGMNWGYGGASPADTVRSLLHALLCCPRCDRR
ncbi:MAG: hypothetical protein ACREX8_03335 [Gammaproteobacteria bacterium]